MRNYKLSLSLPLARPYSGFRELPPTLGGGGGADKIKRRRVQVPAAQDANYVDRWRSAMSAGRLFERPAEQISQFMPSQVAGAERTKEDSGGDEEEEDDYLWTTTFG